MWPRWARAYKGESDGALGPWRLRPVEHVGSTAVPGLLAKPVIDLMAMVADPAAAGRQVQGRFQELGWEPVPPELDKRPWRLLFVKVSADGAHRLAHLHLLVDGARRWDEQLRFREALRGVITCAIEPESAPRAPRKPIVEWEVDGANCIVLHQIR